MPETRKQEISKMLEDINAELKLKYPEDEHAWLHDVIKWKTKLEVEACQLG